MTEWIDRLVNEKRFKEKFEALETLEQKLEFCKNFLADHVPTEKLLYDSITEDTKQPLKARAVNSTDDDDLTPYSNVLKTNVYTSYGPVETIQYNQLGPEDSMYETYVHEDIIRAIAVELYKKGYIKIDSEKKFDTLERLYRGRVHVVRGK